MKFLPRTGTFCQVKDAKATSSFSFRSASIYTARIPPPKDASVPPLFLFSSLAENGKGSSMILVANYPKILSPLKPAQRTEGDARDFSPYDNVYEAISALMLDILRLKAT